MQRILVATLSLTLFLLAAAPMQAQADIEGGDFVYYGFEPDIVTNYLRQGRKLGYVRVSVEVMIDGSENLGVIEHHAPLLRAALVETLGRQPEDKIKSLAGREEIRRTCLEIVRTLMKQEVGQDLAADLLFTKYLYY